jgi:hypothetical protein
LVQLPAQQSSVMWQSSPGLAQAHTWFEAQWSLEQSVSMEQVMPTQPRQV